jgi:hypothetical protein
MSAGVGKWLASGRMGASSTALAAATLGVTEWNNPPDHPHDSDDLGRCLLLYGMAPEAREGLKRLAAVSGQWKRLADNWEKLIDIFDDSQACSALIDKLVNPNNLHAYEFRKGDDGRWDIFPWSDKPSARRGIRL